MLPTECRGCSGDVTCSASQLPDNPRLSYHHINTRLLKIVILYYVTLAKIYIIRFVAITGDYRKLCTRAATFITVTVTPPVIMIYHYLQNSNSDSSSLIAIQHTAPFTIMDKNLQTDKKSSLYLYLQKKQKELDGRN